MYSKDVICRDLMSIEAKVNLHELLSRIFEVSREFEIKCQRGEPECNEDNFRARVEDLFYEYAWSKPGISKPEYEYKVYIREGFIAKYYGRIDAYYGLTFFEYKLPELGLKSDNVRKDTISRCANKYIPGLLSNDRSKAIVERIRGKGLTPLIRFLEA